MIPSQVTTELHTIIAAKKVAFIHGPTGIGKTQVVEAYAKAQGFNCEVLPAAQLDPVDARGIPIPIAETKTTDWYPPKFLPRDGQGLLFLDELNRANQDTQSALYQLILEGRIGDYILPPDWHIIAAGNRDTDGCMVQPMSRALKNRFIHLEMEASYADWHNWANASNIVEHVIAFMRFRPTALDEATEAAKDGDGKHQERLRNANSFATPRSWEFASDLLRAAFAQGRNLHDCYSLMEGTVGEGMASEFVAYCDVYLELPDLDLVIADPSTFVSTKNPSKLYAICTGLAARSNKKTFGNIKKILDQISPEYAHWTIDDCLNRNKKDISSHPAYIEWVYKNIDYVT